MNDLEICKRIAAIEGNEYEDGELVRVGGQWVNPMLDNVLANAWCYSLVLDYNIELSPILQDGWLATIADKYDNNGNINHEDCHQRLDINPNRAIFLVIIAAHKGA